MKFRKLGGRILAVSAVGLLAASTGVAMASGLAGVGPQAVFQPQGVKLQRITAAVQMTKGDKNPYRAFTGPTHMLVDPSNPRIIVAATAEMRTTICYLMRSTNAGQTWQILPAIPALNSYPYCTGPTAGVALSNIAWGRNNTLYYAMDGFNTADGGASRAANTSVLLAKSTNLGNSWTTTVVDNNRGKTGTSITHDGPVTGLAVDTSGPQDVVYVGFGRSYPKAPKHSARGSGNYPMVAVSTNGGATFAPPVDLNKFVHLTLTVSGKSYPLVMSSFGTPYLVAHDGVVEAVAGGTGLTRKSIPKSSLGRPMLVARSTDQGRTWSVSTLSPPVVTPTGAQTGVGWTPVGGKQGTFLITYAATPNEQKYAAPVIVFQRSTNLGLTWTSPVILDNDTLHNLYSSFFPQLGVAPNGRVDVTWWDNRKSHGYAYDIYYTYSTNGGATWAPNVRVTAKSVSFGAGVSYNSDVRQPPGVASANQYAAIGYPDAQLATPQTETQDDFSNVVQFSPLPAASSNLAAILAAIFGGLVIAGLILLVFVMSRRRSEGPPPPKVQAREPVGAG